jgi:tRNA dimethylallyltransferase
MSGHNKPRIIVICGATGIGKTATAIDIAEKFGGEIVGADSMQIYRYMDIGTAKPTPREQALATHHMIDIIDPDQPFDAVQYAAMARKVISGLNERNILPVVAGGTGLYIKALISGLFEAPPSDPRIRSRLKQECQNMGVEALHKRLATCDPVTAQRLHPNDTYRIIRALEIFEATGRPLSQHHRNHKVTPPLFETLKIGLSLDREVLYDRINRRVDLMMEMGFGEEVRSLLDRGYGAHLKSMQSLGYRHMTDCLEGRLPMEEALRTMKRDTRRYAKRQMTWFGADPEIQWTDVGHRDSVLETVRAYLDVTY